MSSLVRELLANSATGCVLFSFPLTIICLGSDLTHTLLSGVVNVLNLVQLKNLSLFYTAFLLSSGNTGYIKKADFAEGEEQILRISFRLLMLKNMCLILC